jgi:hypothetical protein
MKEVIIDVLLWTLYVVTICIATFTSIELGDKSVKIQKPDLERPIRIRLLLVLIALFAISILELCAIQYRFHYMWSTGGIVCLSVAFYILVFLLSACFPSTRSADQISKLKISKK